jgi:tetratricopeptide (TPR) repeat protein
MNFSLNDQRHLAAAQGWLGLGDWLAANEELEQITPDIRAHPAVVSLRYEVYAAGRKWDGAAEVARALVDALPERPEFWINLAYSTRRKPGGGIPQAKEILTEARVKFPKQHQIAFNLACYECQLGNLELAIRHLEEAIDLAGKRDIRQMALDDPDLEPLWKDIAEI